MNVSRHQITLTGFYSMPATKSHRTATFALAITLKLFVVGGTGEPLHLVAPDHIFQGEGSVTARVTTKHISIQT